MPTAPARTTEVDEATLIARIRAGETSLFLDLIRPYERSVYLLAYSVLTADVHYACVLGRDYRRGRSQDERSELGDGAQFGPGLGGHTSFRCSARHRRLCDMCTHSWGDDPMKPPSRWWLVLLFLGGLITAWLVLPVSNWLLALVDWVRAAGATGFITYAALYALATVLLLPGSVLTLGAGFVYGPIWGVLLASPASVLGATLAFLLGRFVARDWIRHRIATNPRFEAVDAAVGKGGFKIVLLLRLSPIFPFTLLNYALGLTRVRLRDYVLASFIGMLPGTVL